MQVVALVVVLANRTLKRLQPHQGGVLVDIALEGDGGEEVAAAGSTEASISAVVELWKFCLLTRP